MPYSMRPEMFMVDWNASQYFWFITGSGLCFKTANPSSMYLFKNGRKARSSGERLCCSKIQSKRRFAIAVAGPVPVAILIVVLDSAKISKGDSVVFKDND